jgi:hypothetical protein
MQHCGDQDSDNWIFFAKFAPGPDPQPKTCAEKYPNDLLRMILCYLGILKSTATQRTKVQKSLDNWKAGKF